MGERSGTELADRLRRSSSGRFHVLGTPSAVVLGEVLVHAQDALRPIGQSLELDPDDVVPVLGIYHRFGRIAFHRRTAKGVRLVAEDAAWTAGRGPDVEGKAIDLLLLMANRRQVLASLHGPGVSQLA